MEHQTPTPHIEAKYGEIAKTVFMAGDPLRAKFMAERYLENPVQFNNVRGMLGFTGTYKGHRVSIMGHGMGIPSIGIYSYELFNFYDVDTIVRVGSAGAYHKDLHIGDIVIALGACTNSNYASQYNLPGTFAPIADFGLARKAVEKAEEFGYRYMVGNIYSSDVFYEDTPSAEQWAKMGVLGVEMESYALYCNALRANKKALCICTVSDSFVYPEENTTAEERQNSFTKMMEIALTIAD